MDITWRQAYGALLRGAYVTIQGTSGITDDRVPFAIALAEEIRQGIAAGLIFPNTNIDTDLAAILDLQAEANQSVAGSPAAEALE